MINRRRIIQSRKHGKSRIAQIIADGLLPATLSAAAASPYSMLGWRCSSYAARCSCE